MPQATYDTIVQECLAGRDCTLDCGSNKGAIRTRFTFYNWRLRQIKYRSASRWTETQLRRVSVALTGAENQEVRFSASGLGEGEVSFVSMTVKEVGVPFNDSGEPQSKLKPLVRQSETVVTDLGYTELPMPTRTHSDQVLAELGWATEQKLEKPNGETEV